MPLFEIFRILRGSVNVLDKRTGKTLKILQNETRVGAQRSARPKHVYDYLIPETDGDERIAFADFEKFVTRQRHLNRQFFERLRSSLAMCVVAKKCGNYTESFLYFYRILEHVSLAFPLTYALNETDFTKAHDFLKDLFRNENEGDLSVMKSFVPKIATIGGYDGECFKFEFTDCTLSDAKACLVQLKKCFGINNDVVSFDQSDEVTEFSVRFNSMHSFIVKCRNRMFHDRAGEINLDLSEMGGSEILCQVIMDQSLHWFSKVYAEIVRTLLRREF